jgi:hypothetical protein
MSTAGSYTTNMSFVMARLNPAFFTWLQDVEARHEAGHK